MPFARIERSIRAPAEELLGRWTIANGDYEPGEKVKNH